MLILEFIFFSWLYFCIMCKWSSRFHRDSCGLRVPDQDFRAPRKVQWKHSSPRNHCPALGHLLGENHSIDLKSTEKPKRRRRKKVPYHFTTVSILIKTYFCPCNGGFIHFKKTSWFHLESQGKWGQKNWEYCAMLQMDLKSHEGESF